MKEKKIKFPYEEPHMETVMLDGSDIVTASSTASGEPEDGWNDNLPTGGWV